MKTILEHPVGKDVWEGKYKSTPNEVVRFMVREVIGALPPEDLEFFQWNVSETLEKDLVEMFLSGQGVPGGRVIKYFSERLSGAKNKNLTPANCFVLPIHEDSIWGINKCTYELEETFKWGGGSGVVISGLRPRDSFVNNSAEISSGAASFVEKFNGSAKIIGQDGRRGALITLLNVHHPDIEEFINLKVDGGLEATNISVMITDGFMEALNDGGEIELWWPKEVAPCDGGKTVHVDYIADCYNHQWADFFCVKADGSFRKKEVWKKVRAKDIWQKIAWAAWSCGDPGVIFWDKVLKDNPYASGVNPCGEEPLPAYSPCALAHENFAIVEDVEKVTGLLYVFLNALLWYSIREKAFPLEAQLESTNKFRPIGIGFLGLADFFIRKGAFYGDQKSIFLLEDLMRTKKETENSLNEKYGQFYGVDKFNCQTSTVAPCGTLSMLLQVGSGIEPLFELEFYKSFRGEQVKITHPIPKGRKQFAITAHQIPPEKRIAVQEVAQKYTDGSISSTINLPKTANVVDIEYIYYLAYERNLKGITIFRDGSKEGALSKTFNRDTVGRYSVLDGKTAKVPFQDSWYVTVNFFNDTPVEVFIHAGKAGSELTAWTEMAGRLVSLHLRRGGKIEDILKELDDIKGPNPVIKDGWILQSGPDGIGKGIAIALTSKSSNFGWKDTCKNCGAESYVRIGGCGQCQTCGYTQCD